MADQRGRDDPPIFTIDPDLQNGKYHALLMEPIAWEWAKPVDTIRDTDPPRTAKGQAHTVRPMGIYAFESIKARDKFVRVCNSASGIDEYFVCKPVTVPGLVPLPTTTQRGTVTSPVTPHNQKETTNG